ncbi:MAG: dimethylsulfoniopropionate lyase [Alphaproteobacteria bacterium]|nr:dimethylsulfoniopropionate lyase [Alphaproteobacteria bacterium]
MVEAPAAALRLIAEIDEYLAALEADWDGVAGARRELARVREAGTKGAPAGNPGGPLCGHLDAALDIAAGRGAAALVGAIRAASAGLYWRTYDAYPPERIGAGFPGNHGFARLIGPGGTIHNDDFGLGLFVMAPRTFYRDHCHPAPELYAPLTGPHQWRFDRGPWTSRPAHQPVWNEPLAVHATLSGDAPFLCVYIWTREIGAPAVLVEAPDWADIESGL